MTRSFKVTRMILVLLVLSIIGLTWYGPIPQWDSYHAFADARTFDDHRNMLNVWSNFAFTGAAFLGLVHYVFLSGELSGYPEVYDDPRRGNISLIIFILGVLGTAAGSSYYHANPTDETLVYDRLPMTICFAALYAEFLGEYVSWSVGRFALWALLFFGVGSVYYWQEFDDLRPYALVQFFPLVTIPIIAAMVGFENRSLKEGIRYLISPSEKSTRLWRNTLLLYLLAKIFEHFDAEIFAWGNVVSGHTLKHIASGIACYMAILAMVHCRRPKWFT